MPIGRPLTSAIVLLLSLITSSLAQAGAPLTFLSTPRALWGARAPGEDGQPEYKRAVFLVEAEGGLELWLYNKMGTAPARAGFQKAIPDLPRAALLFARGRRPEHNPAPIPGMDQTLLVTAPSVPQFIHVYSFNGDPLMREGTTHPTHVILTPNPDFWFADELAGNEIPSRLRTGGEAESLLKIFYASQRCSALLREVVERKNSPL